MNYTPMKTMKQTINSIALPLAAFVVGLTSCAAFAAASTQDAWKAEGLLWSGASGCGSKAFAREFRVVGTRMLQWTDPDRNGPSIAEAEAKRYAAEPLSASECTGNLKQLVELNNVRKSNLKLLDQTVKNLSGKKDPR